MGRGLKIKGKGILSEDAPVGHSEGRRRGALFSLRSSVGERQKYRTGEPVG